MAAGFPHVKKRKIRGKKNLKKCGNHPAGDSTRWIMESEIAMCRSDSMRITANLNRFCLSLAIGFGYGIAAYMVAGMDGRGL